MSNLINSIDQVIQENDLPFEWSDKINSELKDINPNKKLKRIDLRKKSFVTIDGKDAKDFDDAVYCEKETDGFILQVAIADVADIVDCGSEIDKEAIKRGTSIYFPKKVIPMLPEKISNDLCSLVPKKDRNVLVCKIYLDINGDIESYGFKEATINSHKRFTYNEVEYLKNNASDIESSILDSVNALEELTLKRLKNRVERSALEIDSAEPTLKFDNQDNLSEIHIPKRLFAHQMIEEAMILANICAAKYIKKHIGYGIYRVHEEPEVLKIESLKKFFSLKGLSSKSFLKTIELINGFIKYVNKYVGNIMMIILILETLIWAQYSTKEIGHFGLQLKEYSHFTSPIRRYPDLVAHRLIKEILHKAIQKPNQEKLEEVLAELSSLEKRAEKSSRQVVQQMICHHLKQFIGDDFSSMIVGITEFGLFCEIDNHYISGLVHVSDLRRDRYIFDKEANILKGRKTGKTFKIGQKLTVKLANVIPEQRKLVLVPK